ncbi:LysR substrate-binding domain-containing protein [Tsukamurella pseudospumae]|uniref:LysR family transcriptional regulator n=1 Tax=Tsukamurella pseudospumae TaxID=239498 RepID=A0A138A7X1_9ACTN|nr:LysR substrate-binding domain-containing protein [Tsukamurella pseudospumae]KXO99178.1 LysR family transcriptional regulator [Tsukamurella pseudospumae]KXP06467.1 LysR family transcriptional regulator [Tsukamurella pseudospumae]
MNLRQLRYFVAVAEERHFGRAAQRLHMAQPPLSHQIRQLESDLGVELLHRTTRRVDLTDAGRAYLERARAILSSVDDAAQHARRVAAGATGHLTIGCVGTATYSLLPPLARRLAEELPGIDFAFRGEMLVPDQVEALRSGAIDIALLRPPVADQSLRIRVVRREPWVVALPADHPLTRRERLRVSDLAGAAFIVHSADRRSAMYDRVAALLREGGVAPTIRHEVGETSTLATLVAAGLGIAVAPEPITALRLDGLSYRPLDGAGTGVDLAVAHLADREDRHLARVADLIVDLTAV